MSGSDGVIKVKRKINSDLYIRLSSFLYCLLLGSFLLMRPVYHWNREALYRARSGYIWTACKRNPSKTAGEPSSPAAWLKIRGIGISTMVVLGDSKDNLLKFPALSLNGDRFSSGSRGAKIIMAHRDIHFRDLGKLKENQNIEIELPDETKLYYKVFRKEIIDPDQVDYYLEPYTDQETLILMTCYPFHFIGPAPKRYLVFSRKVDG